MPEVAHYFKRLRMDFERNEARGLREVSNELVQRSSRSEEKHYSDLALIAYALHKILSKVHFIEDPEWQKTRKGVLAKMQSAQLKLKKNDLAGFQSALREIISAISAADTSMGNYVTGIMEKARVKNASSLYGMGLSLSKAAEKTGANKKDLLNYIGGTKMHDEEGITLPIARRLGALRKMVKK